MSNLLEIQSKYVNNIMFYRYAALLRGGGGDEQFWSEKSSRPTKPKIYAHVLSAVATPFETYFK